MLEYLVIFGVILQFWGNLVYAKATLKGEAKPNRVTWLLWGIVPLIAAAAAFTDGARWPALPAFASGVGSLIVFAASFANKKTGWRLNNFDYLCGASSILALFFWYLTKDPLVAIFLAIISDFFSTIPTLAKAWRYPETENITPYITGLVNLATPFFAMKNWAPSEYAFPLYCVIMGSILLYAVARKRLVKVLFSAAKV